MRIRKILWPTDFSECAGAALDHAVLMASRHGATLELLHVTVLADEDPFHPPDKLPDRREIQRRRRRIEAMGLQRPRVRASLEDRRHQRRAPAAAPEILRFSTEKSVDLIGSGGHGQRGFRGFFLGGVAEEVVRLAPCPVLSVRKPIDRADSDRIVVPIDYSDHSAQALRAARRLALAGGGRLELVHVVEPVPGPRDPGLRGASIERTADGLAQFADEVLGRPEVEVRVEVIEGIAAASITAHAANSGAEMIVIATHGLTGQRHFLLDSVTEKVVRTAACPVLTIKGPRAPDAHEGAAAGLA